MTAVYQAKNAGRRSRCDIRGLDIAVTEWGDPEAPRFFYLHGWGDNGQTFQFVVDELQKDWHIVAPHWRGFGLSVHTGGYWFPDYLADLHALLALYSDGQPVDLVGHSMGGNVASLYSGVFPEHVRTLINVEGFGLPDSDASAAPERLRRWIEAENATPRYATYRAFEPLAMRVRARSPRLSQERALFVAEAWASRHADDVVRLHADPAHKLPNPILYRAAEALACWSSIRANVTMMVGGTSSEREHAERFRATVTDAGVAALKHENVTGVGHMIHFEAPETIARVIERDLIRDHSFSALS
ncbi:MAG: alpha/beta fold hydrolase [Gammaproteobacteria bacterium]